MKYGVTEAGLFDGSAADSLGVYFIEMFFAGSSEARWEEELFKRFLLLSVGHGSQAALSPSMRKDIMPSECIPNVCKTNLQYDLWSTFPLPSPLPALAFPDSWCAPLGYSKGVGFCVLLIWRQNYAVKYGVTEAGLVDGSAADSLAGIRFNASAVQTWPKSLSFPTREEGLLKDFCFSVAALSPSVRKDIMPSECIPNVCKTNLQYDLWSTLSSSIPPLPLLRFRIRGGMKQKWILSFFFFSVPPSCIEKELVSVCCSFGDKTLQ
ncbi:hypothetical protein CEXT_381691 [Caerostris extrusa]|uniref:Uncharacterized protein n=1 Tax=Caerostris extrusa TaxID=172846 RepID=A0AAV4WDI0_CAEEX|nr:hypothetical protein CEXT_381691 [Caerostris extrusa]